ncbi:MAG: SAM-dependent chlorinase/fluorinase, partial [bacterium]
MSNKIITLTTDFGNLDSYVASMKGVILSISPLARIIDITHEIEPQRIVQASIVMSTCTPYFPEGSIHMAVVDPGVGTDRALLAVRCKTQVYLAPDNGLLGFILEKGCGSEVRKIENRDLFLPQVSRTFHGRDILAPVAAHLAEGVTFEELGPEFTEFHPNIFPYPQRDDDTLRGEIIYRDHFGNLMTNINREDMKDLDVDKLELECGYTKISGLSQSYCDVEKGELLFLFGSAGYLEIALRE